jgi:TRAP-type mannitol/chloroaromatic compound transport system permease small subunit
MSTPASRLASAADRAVCGLGRAVSWLSLAMVLTTVVVVVLRKFFDLGFIWMQESVTWMHAALFMLAAGYTLSLDEHVRVDIFYRRLSPLGQAWVDTIGVALLLVPTCLVIIIYGWDYVAVSWSIGEGSPEAGGLAGLYLLKTLLIVTPALLLVEGLALVTLRWARLGAETGPPDGAGETRGP